MDLKSQAKLLSILSLCLIGSGGGQLPENKPALIGWMKFASEGDSEIQKIKESSNKNRFGIIVENGSHQIEFGSVNDEPIILRPDEYIIKKKANPSSNSIKNETTSTTRPIGTIGINGSPLDEKKLSPMRFNSLKSYKMYPGPNSKNIEGRIVISQGRIESTPDTTMKPVAEVNSATTGSSSSNKTESNPPLEKTWAQKLFGWPPVWWPFAVDAGNDKVSEITTTNSPPTTTIRELALEELQLGFIPIDEPIRSNELKMNSRISGVSTSRGFLDDTKPISTSILKLLIAKQDAAAKFRDDHMFSHHSRSEAIESIPTQSSFLEPSNRSPHRGKASNSVPPLTIGSDAITHEGKNSTGNTNDKNLVRNSHNHIQPPPAIPASPISTPLRDGPMKKRMLSIQQLQHLRTKGWKFFRNGMVVPPDFKCPLSTK